MKHKYALVVCARWEKDHIIEWIAYHKIIGFNHIYIYSNDDDPSELYRIIKPIQITSPQLITYNHCGRQGDQRGMYFHFWENYSNEAEWVIFLDVDEFLNTNGAGIDEIVEAFSSDIGAIYFNWILFGNNGFKDRPEGQTLLNYTRRQAAPHPYTKNIVRSAAVDVEKLKNSDHAGFWHGWEHQGRKDVLHEQWRKTINVLGHSMEEYYDNFPHKANEYLAKNSEEIFSFPRIHHYSIRSEADFLLREARGTQGAFQGQVHWANIFRDGSYVDHLQNINACSDFSLADMWRRELTYQEASI